MFLPDSVRTVVDACCSSARSTDKLSTILADRTKYYENADIVVDIASLAGEELGAPTAATMYRIMTAINNRSGPLG